VCPMAPRSVLLALVAVCIGSAVAFTSRPPVQAASRSSTVGVVRMGYVPDGLSKEEWEKIKKKERAAKSGLGRVGTNKFKSRSMDSFVRALEKGEAKHLMPVDPRDVKSGKIKMEDVPYMQRGGSWDNSDVKGARRLKWTQEDKQYDSGGFKKEQSVSIFGGENLPWTNWGSKEKDERSVSQGGRVGGANQKRSTRPSAAGGASESKSFNLFGGLFGKKDD